ncbi:MAG: hypothetical protein HOV94_23385 [Saccharothrix sp.]|nr:hypothetical protein [Saccharothrix sp.]
MIGTCDVAASSSTIRGLITKVEVLDKWDASGPAWVTASQATYDACGRPLDVYDARGEKTTTAGWAASSVDRRALTGSAIDPSSSSAATTSPPSMESPRSELPPPVGP